MRSSTILSLIVLAGAAAPSIAAPVSDFTYAKRQSSQAVNTQDESGAFWGALLRFAPTIINAVGGLFGGNKREYEELFAREFHDQFSRELLARAGEDESGAFWGALLRFAPTIINAVGGLFGGNKREFEEMLTREFHEHYARELAARDGQDESGAFWGALLRLVPTAVNAISGLFGGNKREFEEMLTREFHEHYARELAARGGQDESGAFLGALLRFAPTIINAVGGLFGGNKREYEELFAREFHDQFSRELLARAGEDESGAFWGALLRLAPTIVNAVGGLFGGNKREFEELYARHFDHVGGFRQFGPGPARIGLIKPMARSLNELD